MGTNTWHPSSRWTQERRTAGTLTTTGCRELVAAPCQSRSRETRVLYCSICAFSVRLLFYCCSVWHAAACNQTSCLSNTHTGARSSTWGYSSGVERLLRMQEVKGSIPFISILFFFQRADHSCRSCAASQRSTGWALGSSEPTKLRLFGCFLCGRPATIFVDINPAV